MTRSVFTAFWTVPHYLSQLDIQLGYTSTILCANKRAGGGGGGGRSQQMLVYFHFIFIITGPSVSTGIFCLLGGCCVLIKCVSP